MPNFCIFDGTKQCLANNAICLLWMLLTWMMASNCTGLQVFKSAQKCAYILQHAQQACRTISCCLSIRTCTSEPLLHIPTCTQLLMSQHMPAVFGSVGQAGQAYAHVHLMASYKLKLSRHRVMLAIPRRGKLPAYQYRTTLNRVYSKSDSMLIRHTCIIVEEM